MALVGERKALAAAVLAFYMLYFLLVAFAAPPEMQLGPLFAAMSGLYGLAFFALVAGYFWARWFAIGLGIYGLILGVMGLWSEGLHPVFLFVAGTHGGMSLILWGTNVASQFDGRDDWRDRFHLDDTGTQRLGKAVIRIGISLPMLIGYGLTPRQGMGETLFIMGAIALVGLGSWGLLRMRTWGLLALLAAAGGVLTSLVATAQVAVLGDGSAVDLTVSGSLGGIFLALAVVPFALPMVRYLRGQ